MKEKKTFEIGPYQVSMEGDLGNMIEIKEHTQVIERRIIPPELTKLFEIIFWKIGQQK